MATIRVNFDTDKLRRDIKGSRDQVPFAARLTINQLARNSKDEIDNQIKSTLDRPTRYTLRAMRTENAKRSNMTSAVKVNDKPRSGGKSESQVLEHLFQGGGRIGKGVEGALKGLGVLPAGMFILPGNAAPLESFGNIKRSFIRKLIQYFKTFRPSGENVSTLEPGVWMRKFDRVQKKSRKKVGKAGSFEFFVVHKQIGAVNRSRKGSRSRRPEPILLFSDQPRYRKYFDMKKTVEKIIIRDLDREFEKHYELAVRTAKRL